MVGSRIAVAGAGIAGLIAAIALTRRGFGVTIYEQAREMREIGAGLQITPNGTRILIDLGLAEALAPVVVEAAGKEVRHWQSGKSWKLFDLGQDCIARFGAPYWMVHRGDFHRVLLDAATALDPDMVQLGHAVTGVAQDGTQVTLDFGDGSRATADVLIGADGVHSATRAALGHHDRPHFTGIMAWRGIARTDGLSADLRRQVGTNWLGPGGHVITYPLKGGAAMNFVGIVEGRDWPVESWTEVGTNDECLADFAGWHPAVGQIIRNLDQPFKWALAGREPLLRWAHDRVCLIGDSAHPTLPFLAQGANMAIEDGLLIARCLDANRRDPAAALEQFSGLRADRAATIVRKSTEMAKHFHNPLLGDPAQADAYITREWDPEKIRLRYDWLFEYDARTIPLETALAA